VLGSLGDKAAAGKEIDEGWRAGGHEFMRTVSLRPVKGRVEGGFWWVK
jgi:hypothetical protein